MHPQNLEKLLYLKIQIFKAMKENKITYIFGSGRNNKIENNDSFAKEMFYGYFDLKKNYDTKIVETSIKQNFIKKFLTKLINKLTGIGIHFENVLSSEDEKRVLTSTELFFGNQQLLFSFLFFLPRFKKKDIKVNVFAMGMMNYKKNFISKILLDFIFNNISRVIFISEPEYDTALKLHTKYKEKIYHIHFGVDIDFWEKKEINNIKKNSLLFIGNDLNRDYGFLINLVKKLPEIDFKIISKRFTKNELSFQNVELISGDWHSDKLSDQKIRELYSNSTITLIPLKNSIQPSGQSVCLQSMACQTPVIMTKTIGFWNPKNLLDESDIILLDPDLDIWVDEINKLINDEKLRSKLSQNALRKVKSKYTSKQFSKGLIDLIESK